MSKWNSPGEARNELAEAESSESRECGGKHEGDRGVAARDARHLADQHIDSRADGRAQPVEANLKQGQPSPQPRLSPFEQPMAKHATSTSRTL